MWRKLGSAEPPLCSPWLYQPDIIWQHHQALLSFFICSTSICMIITYHHHYHSISSWWSLSSLSWSSWSWWRQWWWRQWWWWWWWWWWSSSSSSSASAAWLSLVWKIVLLDFPCIILFYEICQSRFFFFRKWTHVQHEYECFSFIYLIAFFLWQLLVVSYHYINKWLSWSHLLQLRPLAHYHLLVTFGGFVFFNRIYMK